MDAEPFRRNYIPRIPVDKARVVAITGERDNNTLPRFGKACVDEMKARGIDARFELVEGRGHGSVLASETIVDAVREVSKP